ncbi:MAG: diguanylate cyclase [Ruminococcaceae bacterium]|nr:diguanylate cyclase [Oscillospiraceae bacterium]
MKDFSVVFFTDNKDKNQQLIKLLESKSNLTICSYSADSWDDVDFYSNLNTAFVLDEMPDENDALWLISKLYEDNVFAEVPILFTSFEAMRVFESAGFSSFAYDILPDPFSYDVALRRLINISEIRQLKLQIFNLTKIHTKRILSQANKLREQNIKMQSMNFDLVELLVAAIESRDMESGQHIKRIRFFTKALTSAVAQMCPEYGISKEQEELIFYASSVHDIGKISIPDAIMLKPGRLTPDEFEIMKTHTTRGALLLGMLDDISESNEYFKYCQEICHYHHERWDGSGYPNGLKGDETPISAQIVAIADCYDALTSHRTYKTALKHEEAVELILNGACGAFSPQLLKCFSSVVNDFAKIERELKNDAPTTPSEQNKFISENTNDSNDNKNKSLDICEDAIISAYDIVFEADIAQGLFRVTRGKWDKFFPYVPKNFAEFVSQCHKICHPADLPRFSNKVNLASFNELAKMGKGKTRLEFRVIRDGVEYLAVGFIVFRVNDNKDIIALDGAFSIYDDDEILSDIKRGFGVTDGLTGLLLPKQFEIDVDSYIKNNPNSKNLLVHIDIDDMSICNNLFGYEYGNALIKEFAAKLKGITDKDKIICKSASDKFLLFVKNVTKQSEMVLFIENLHNLLRKPYRTATESGEFTATMGIARYPNDGKNFKKLAISAEYASKSAKISGKSAYTFYNVGMRHLAAYSDDSAGVGIQLDMKNDHEPKFVPVCDARTGELVCYDYIPFSTSHDAIAITTEVYYELNKSNATKKNLSIISLKSLLYVLIEMKQQGHKIPPVSVYTMIMPDDMPSFIQEIKSFTEENDCSGLDVCIIFPQDFLEGVTIRKLRSYADTIKSLGFKIGIYLIGTRYIHNYCYVDDIFDRHVVTSEFIEHTISTGASEKNLKYAAMTLNNLKAYVTNVTIPTQISDYEIKMMLEADACDFSVAQDAIFGTNALIENYKLRCKTVKYSSQVKESKVEPLDPALFYYDMANNGCAIITYHILNKTLRPSYNINNVFGYNVLAAINDKENFKITDTIHKDDLESVLAALARTRTTLKSVFFKARLLVDPVAKKYQWFDLSALCAVDENGTPLRIQCVISRAIE